MRVFRSRAGFRYVAALLGGFAAFLAFVGIDYRGTVTPVRSVGAASLLCAAVAGFFGYRWPRHSYLWGVLASAVFIAYLVIVFGFLALDGDVDYAPLLYAGVIAAASCAGALAGRASSASAARDGVTGRAARVGHAAGSTAGSSKPAERA